MCIGVSPSCNCGGWHWGGVRAVSRTAGQCKPRRASPTGSLSAGASVYKAEPHLVPRVDVCARVQQHLRGARAEGVGQMSEAKCARLWRTLLTTWALVSAPPAHNDSACRSGPTRGRACTISRHPSAAAMCSGVRPSCVGLRPHRRGQFEAWLLACCFCVLHSHKALVTTWLYAPVAPSPTHAPWRRRSATRRGGAAAARRLPASTSRLRAARGRRASAGAEGRGARRRGAQAFQTLPRTSMHGSF